MPKLSLYATKSLRFRKSFLCQEILLFKSLPKLNNKIIVALSRRRIYPRPFFVIMNLKLKNIAAGVLLLILLYILFSSLAGSGGSGGGGGGTTSSSIGVSDVFPFSQPAAIALLSLDDASFEYLTEQRVSTLDDASGRFARQRAPRAIDARLYARLDMPRLSQRKAIVTLLTNDAYVLAACVLAHSLRRVKTGVPIVALITDELASSGWAMTRLTRSGFDYVLVVDKIANPAHVALAEQRAAGGGDGGGAAANDAPPLIKKNKAAKMQAHKADVFTKLRVFSLTDYERILYIDADCVVTRNVDHLLERDTPFSFAPSLQPLKKCEKPAVRKFVFRYKDAEWCQSHSKALYHGTIELYNHNAGVMLLEPRLSTFAALMRLMEDELNHDDSCIGQPGCNDQRVINVHYSDPKHKKTTLELEYNIFCDQLITLGWNVDDFDPTIVHYRGGSKPWALDRFADNKNRHDDNDDDDNDDAAASSSSKSVRVERNVYLLPDSIQPEWIESHHNYTLWQLKDQWYAQPAPSNRSHSFSSLILLFVLVVVVVIS
jgi:alpha-N-acetylglucosamine transferase